YEFYVQKEKNIVYSLGAIKGIGISSVKNIVQEREKNGHFYDLFDFCCRTDPHKITRKFLEKLIMSGSCDCLNIDREFLLLSIDH
ncbi:MAG: DNA polymerase III subunit alpha, partial [Buchnera aphidicola]|nr:DNA polymerase III subunit alpha [Buchnera aphidicola]